MIRSRSHVPVAFGLLVLLAFALRAASLDAQSLWRDEVDALRFAQVPWPEMTSSFARPGWNGPLYFWLLRGWVAKAGTSEYSLRFLSLLFGVLCVPLTYVLGWRLFGRRVGLLAGLLVASSPYLVWYGQEAKMYTIVSALVLLAIYALHRGLHGTGKRWWFAMVAATWLALYAHIVSALAIPIEVLLAAVWWPRKKEQRIGALASLAALVLAYLPLLSWQGRLAIVPRETGFPGYTLAQMLAILLRNWSTGVLGLPPPWDVALRALMAGLAIWGLLSLSASWMLGRGRQQPGHLGNALALVLWVVLPLLAVALVSIWQPIFTDRYLIWTAPPFYLLVAMGLSGLPRFRRRRSWALIPSYGLLLTSNLVGVWQQTTVPIKTDFRAAAAYVWAYRGPSAQGQPAASVVGLPLKCYLPLVVSSSLAGSATGEVILFQIPYARHAFDYYSAGHEYLYAEGYYTNHRAADGTYLVTEQELADTMERITARYGVVWLIDTEAETWDARALVKGWLDSSMERTDAAVFTLIGVYRYVRPSSP